MKCKYCEKELCKSNKPRITFACSNCKHKHYRSLNYEHYKARSKKWSAENKERKRELNAQWRIKNPDKFKAKSMRSSRSLAGQFGHGKCKAKRYNQEWSLTKEQYFELRKKDCVYCGSVLNKTGSGLDRKDCSIGYTIDNVVPCCGDCNKIKQDKLTYAEMKILMKEVVDVRKYGHLGLFF